MIDWNTLLTNQLFRTINIVWCVTGWKEIDYVLESLFEVIWLFRLKISVIWFVVGLVLMLVKCTKQLTCILSQLKDNEKFVCQVHIVVNFVREKEHKWKVFVVRSYESSSLLLSHEDQSWWFHYFLFILCGNTSIVVNNRQPQWSFFLLLLFFRNSITVYAILLTCSPWAKMYISLSSLITYKPRI